jgi:hypothetical protein
MSEQTDVLALRDPDLERFRQLGRWLSLAESGRKTEASLGAAAALRYYYAEQLGLSPMAAAELYLTPEGKLGCTALLLRGLAEQHGYNVRPGETSNKSATAILYRDGKELGRRTFTMEDAKTAGIAGKPGYSKYPERMLWARASTYVIRDFASHIAVGLITKEELDEIHEPEPPVPPVTPEPEAEEAIYDELEEYEAAEEQAEQDAQFRAPEGALDV